MAGKNGNGNGRGPGRPKLEQQDDLVVAFVDAYFANSCKPTKAARSIGYGRDAHRLMRHPAVRSRIALRLSEYKAGADEVLGVLAMHMRADVGLLLNEDGAFDWKLAQERGVTPLVKKLKIRERRYRDEDEEEVVERHYELELHDAQAAAFKIANLLGLEQKPKENESDAERKARMYDKLVDRLIEHAAQKFGETLSRVDAINEIAAYQPEIRDYIH
jgi:hypothetical protein